MADNGSGEQTAGNVLGAASPLLGAVPIFGSILSAGAAITSGILESDAAQKQKQQAANERLQANQLQKQAIRPELLAKQRADALAANSDQPGIGIYKDALAQNFAAHLKAIHDSSENGGRAVNAISESLGLNNQALEKLFASNSAYKAGLQKDARGDLWDVGLQQHLLEQEQYGKQKLMYQQANALETAGTLNKQTGANTILGAVGSTAAGLSKTAMWEQMIKGLQSPPSTNASAAGTASANTAAQTEDNVAPTDSGMGFKDLWDYQLNQPQPSYATAASS